MPFNTADIISSSFTPISSVCCQISPKGDISDFIILGLVICLIALIIFSIATYQKMNLTIKRLTHDKQSGAKKEFSDITEAANFLSLESLPVPLVIYDKNGKLQYINSKARHITSTPENETLESNLFESTLISDIDKDIIFNGGDISGTINSNEILSEQPHIFGFPLQPNVIFSYTLHPICDPNGKIRFIIGTSKDTSKSFISTFNADDNLTLIEESMRHTDVTFYIYNIKEDVYYKFNNKRFERVDILTQDYTFRAIEPQQKAQYIEMFLKIKSGELINDRRQYRLFISALNKYANVDTYTCGITDENGNVVSVFQSVHNITNAVKNSEKLESYKKIISSALPIIHLTAWTFDCSSKIFHSTNEDSVGAFSFDSILKAIHPEDQEKFLSTYKKILDGKSDSIYAVFRIHDRQYNDYRFFETYCMSQKDANETITSIIGIIHDITDKFAVERKLEDYSEKAIKFATLSNTWIFSYICKNHTFTSVSHYGYRRQDNPLYYVDFVQIEYRQDLVDLYEQVKAQSITEATKLVKINYSGEVKNCIFSLQAYEYENDTPTKYIGYAHVY